MAVAFPDNPEVAAGLRDLMRAKDCMVRAAVEKAEDEAQNKAGSPAEQV